MERRIINRESVGYLLHFIFRRNPHLRQEWSERRLQALLWSVPDDVVLRKIRGLLCQVLRRDIIDAFDRGLFSDLHLLRSVVRVIQRKEWFDHPSTYRITNEWGKF